VQVQVGRRLVFTVGEIHRVLPSSERNFSLAGLLLPGSIALFTAAVLVIFIALWCVCRRCRRNKALSNGRTEYNFTYTQPRSDGSGAADSGIDSPDRSNGGT
jgi:hypothetical protein